MHRELLAGNRHVGPASIMLLIASAGAHRLGVCYRCYSLLLATLSMLQLALCYSFAVSILLA